MTSQKHIEFQISGMDCADCARTLEGGIAQLDGVEAVQINFATAHMAATGTVDPQVIRDRFEALGYGVSDVSDGAESDRPLSAHPVTGLWGFVRFLRSTQQGNRALIGAMLLVLTSLVGALAISPNLAALVPVAQVVVIVLAGYSIAQRGIRALLISRQITIDLLMSIATLGALLIGETGEGATVIVLFALGEGLKDIRRSVPAIRCAACSLSVRTGRMCSTHASIAPNTLVVRAIKAVHAHSAVSMKLLCPFAMFKSVIER